MGTLRIVCDENIPAAAAAFGPLGELRLVAGRSIGPVDVADADVLLVRSVTRVNAGLLSGSRVRLVGTATIGTDHIDETWLVQRGIGFTSCAGSNARSVVEYVLAGAFHAAGWTGLQPAGGGDGSAADPLGWRWGVVGMGNIGGRLAEQLERLGCVVGVSDPPLAECGRLDRVDTPLLELAAGSDLLTVHVPLTRGVRHATAGLLGAAFFEALPVGSVLVSSSRGEVVDEAALRGWLDRGGRAVLDVWRNEPLIDAGLLGHPGVVIGTPHIAGYSFDGKIAGTVMLHRWLCEREGLQPAFDGSALLAAQPVLRVPGGVEPAAGSDGAAVGRFGRAALATAAWCIRHSYDMAGDDARLRQTLALPSAERAAAFDRLRRDYPRRREFAAYGVEGASPEAAELVRLLGFAGA